MKLTIFILGMNCFRQTLLTGWSTMLNPMLEIDDPTSLDLRDQLLCVLTIAPIWGDGSTILAIVMLKMTRDGVLKPILGSVRESGGDDGLSTIERSILSVYLIKIPLEIREGNLGGGDVDFFHGI